MNILALTVGLLGENCYLVWNEPEHAAVIDPGAEAQHILNSLQKNGLRAEAILLTHGHFDHIGAVAELKEQTGARVFAPEEDAELLTDPTKNLSGEMGINIQPFEADRLLRDGDRFEIGSMKFEFLHTPGHTKGSGVYRVEDVLFTGDTLFAGSMGRTDFYGGDFRAMEQSLSRLAGLEGDFRVLCGHGEGTTLEQERRSNPFLRVD